MAKLHLICGLPGSGKSTLARQLEEEGKGFRLAPDDWMLALGFNLYDETSRTRVEALQWKLTQRLLSSGVDVILENGFWSQEERNSLRSAAEALGAKTQLHYLAVPIEELEYRILARNQAVPAEAVVNPSDLRSWWNLFEPPTDEELGG